MMPPSNRHIELQNMVSTWISNRSFKRCGLPEADVVGYIADFVAIAGMNNECHSRYASRSGLTTKVMNRRLVEGVFSSVVSGDIDRWYVCVFEVKVSRADFLHTFGRNKKSPHAKARMEPVGTAHWVVAEKGICTADELPDLWGLLTPYGAGLSEKKMPKLNVLADSEIHAMAFDLLWLTMNFRYSQYIQMGEMGKAIKDLRQAIGNGMPKAELLELAEVARKAGRGFA